MSQIDIPDNKPSFSCFDKKAYISEVHVVIETKRGYIGVHDH